MEDKVKSLKDLLGKVTEDLRTFENKIEDFEEQQLELAKQQETCQQTVDDLTTKQYATDQALGNLIANQETTDIKTKQAIDEVRVKQDLYQKQTQQSLDEITATNAHTSSIPLDKGKAEIILIYHMTSHFKVYEIKI